jgi:hypothetical protein
MDGVSYTFKNTLYDIADSPKDIENFTEYPGCNVIYGRERCENQDRGILQTTGMNRQILENSFPLTIHVFNQNENPRKWFEDMLSDLQALFGSNYQLVNASNEATAFTTLYTESEPFILRTTKPNCALEVIFEVHYRQRRENPTEKI